jgi:hypothetical protein
MKLEALIALDKINEAKRLAAEKAKAALLVSLEKFKEDNKKNIKNIEKEIGVYMKDFHSACNELIANCDKRGVLSEYKYISKIVNYIAIIILTKYLHLEYYYNDLYKDYKYDSQLAISLIMYDDTMKDYFESKVPMLNVVDELQKVAFEETLVIYQNNNLTQDVSKQLIYRIPNNTDSYNMNYLFNRQYIFDMKRSDNYNDEIYDNITVNYNKYNNLDVSHIINFKSLSFPYTLSYAFRAFYSKLFNYNITNSVLPRYICIATREQKIKDHDPFSALIDEINERLLGLPIITGLATEATIKRDYYNGILANMKKNMFGTNDIIRNNILYSLNAQTKTYVERNMAKHLQNITQYKLKFHNSW